MAINIVGYGTLLYSSSVQDTLGRAAGTKIYLPVVIHGFRRLFNLLPSHYKPSFKISQEPVERAAANIIVSPGSSFNGLAFIVSDKELGEIDSRESHYKRIETSIFDFTTGKPLGMAFVYSADEQKAVLTNDAAFLPDWIDIQWARTGAYRQGISFGKMYDQTTYLADGRTLVAERYKNYLDQLIIKD